MSLNNYLLKIINEDGEFIGNQVEVPNEEFESREDAEDFINGLPVDAIVTNDVIDPETGEVLLQAGDSKTALQRYTKGDELKEAKRQSNIERLMSRHERLESRGAFLEPEKPLQTLKEQFGISIKDIISDFRQQGEDIAGDFLSDNPNADRQEFDQWAQSAAGDAADSQFRYPDSEIKKIIAFLKHEHITDVIGWAGDEIYEGMRKYARSHGLTF